MKKNFWQRTISSYHQSSCSFKERSLGYEREEEVSFVFMFSGNICLSTIIFRESAWKSIFYIINSWNYFPNVKLQKWNFWNKQKWNYKTTKFLSTPYYRYDHRYLIKEIVRKLREKNNFVSPLRMVVQVSICKLLQFMLWILNNDFTNDLKWHFMRTRT